MNVFSAINSSVCKVLGSVTTIAGAVADANEDASQAFTDFTKGVASHARTFRNSAAIAEEQNKFRTNVLMDMAEDKAYDEFLNEYADLKKALTRSTLKVKAANEYAKQQGLDLKLKCDKHLRKSAIGEVALPKK